MVRIRRYPESRHYILSLPFREAWDLLRARRLMCTGREAWLKPGPWNPWYPTGYPNAGCSLFEKTLQGSCAFSIILGRTGISLDENKVVESRSLLSLKFSNFWVESFKNLLY